MDTKKILNQVESLVSPVLENLGYVLIEQELANESGRWVLRLYIDKEGGVTIDDCARASRGIEDLLEVEGAVPVAYNLEISSPGVFRPLRKRDDFEKFQGERIRLKTLEPVDGRSNYLGILLGFEGDDIMMMVDGEKYKIPYSALSKAKLEPEDIEASKKQH